MDTTLKDKAQQEYDRAFNVVSRDKKDIGDTIQSVKFSTHTKCLMDDYFPGMNNKHTIGCFDECGMRTSMPMNVEDFTFLKDGSSDPKASPKNRGTGSGAGNLRFMGQLRQYGSEATLTAK